MELYVIRHSPVGIKEGICYGQADVKIDYKLFDSYVINLKKRLPKKPDIVYSSDLNRCQKLAHTLYNNYEIDQRLREIHFGDWELKNWDAIDKTMLTDWSNNLLEYAPGNGENLLQLYQRVENFILELRKTKTKSIVLITHSGVIRCIWAYILKMPIENCIKIPIDFGEVFKVFLGSKPNEDRIIQKG